MHADSRRLGCSSHPIRQIPNRFLPLSSSPLAQLDSCQSILWKYEWHDKSICHLDIQVNREMWGWTWLLVVKMKPNFTSWNSETPTVPVLLNQVMILEILRFWYSGSFCKQCIRMVFQLPLSIWFSVLTQYSLVKRQCFAWNFVVVGPVSIFNPPRILAIRRQQVRQSFHAATAQSALSRAWQARFKALPHKHQKITGDEWIRWIKIGETHSK